jgi:hypothetical protein
MFCQVTVTPDGEVIGWLPAQNGWTDAEGTLWRPAPPKHLAEDIARKFVRRASTRVAIERPSPGMTEPELLDPGVQKDYWEQRIAGHVFGAAACTPDDRGLTFYLSSWRDKQGHRLVLISEVC